jgi:hypothetical protein
MLDRLEPPSTATEKSAQLPHRPSVLRLRTEFHLPGQPDFEQIRDNFADKNGEILDEYYAPNTPAAAVLVRSKEKRICKIALNYDSTIADPHLALMLRSARREERQNSALLSGKAQEIFAQSIYNVIVHLLSVLDLVSKALKENTLTEDEVKKRLSKEGNAAEEDLKHAREFATAAARNSALSWYLWGLPFGVLLGSGLIMVINSFPYRLAEKETGEVNSQLVLCLVAGAIGAVVSVMIRITLDPTPDVTTERKRLVMLLAGAFRPVVGGVFGVVFFAFVMGGLLPFKPGTGDDAGLFFAGLAFLAGFSERWAQDTIVQSTPGLPNAVKRRPTPASDDEPKQR